MGDMQTLEEKKIIHRLSQKKYKLSKKGKIAQNRYNKSIAKRDSVYRWQFRNKFKFSVEKKLRLAVKRGLIKKAPCEVCKNPLSQAHHDDYLKPFDVRWLCNLHHSQWHLKNGEGLNGK